jgi:1-aminocyclopropane-1-carboxylate deaminase/D-cysteine desulfhydrase-like pyridoxal-dependent ACC family enzyme
MDEIYRTSGNVLLDRLFGARLHEYPVGDDEGGADRALDELAERLRSEGELPYVIHLSEEYPPLGALGYVDAAEELVGQLAAMGVPRATIVVASGSAATHAGLLVGLRALGHTEIHVKGICVRRGQDAQWARVLGVCRNTEKLLQSGCIVQEDDISVTDAFLGPAYGLVTEETTRAILLGAREEALILDPVYTGKAFAGFLDFVRRGEVGAEAAVVFLHTGGIPALFAYSPEALGIVGSPTAGGVE